MWHHLLAMLLAIAASNPDRGLEAMTCGVSLHTMNGLPVLVCTMNGETMNEKKTSCATKNGVKVRLVKRRHGFKGAEGTLTVT